MFQVGMGMNQTTKIVFSAVSVNFKVTVEDSLKQLCGVQQLPITPLFFRLLANPVERDCGPFLLGLQGHNLHEPVWFHEKHPGLTET